MMQQRTISFGIIGCGLMGREYRGAFSRTAQFCESLLHLP